LSIVPETLVLRKTLTAWAASPEWPLLFRYDLLRKKPSRSLVHRVYRFMNRALFRLRLARPHVTRYSWLPGLKHGQASEDGSTLLIWAVGVDKDELRSSCEAFMRWLEAAPGWVPVLVTDVADFAWFSRLKWLVEYVPALSGTGPSYRERKQRYLAWRYRDALVVPAAAGRAGAADWSEWMEMKR
jgi:hypothetical protein